VSSGHEVSYRPSRGCCTSWATACRPTARPRRAPSIPTATRSFRHINEKVTAAIAQSRPAISIDTKKKERVGEYANGGWEWAPKGEPVAVNVHDFPAKTLGKAIPYGIYDIGADNGFVNVGIIKETAAFAVASIAAGGSSSARRATRLPGPCRSPPTAVA